MLYCWLDSFIIALLLYIGGYKYKKPPVRMAKYQIGAGKETLTPGLFHGKEAL